MSPLPSEIPAGHSRRLGITIPIAGYTLAQHRRIIPELAGLGLSDVWTAEGSGADAFTPLALAGALSAGLRLGTGIVPVFTRGPAVIAQSAAALADLSPGQVLLGIGASVPRHVTSYNGIPFASPYGRVRDTLRFLRRAFSGAIVSERYETFEVEGFALSNPPAVPPKIIVAALRPRMLRLAVEEADGFMTNFLSAQDLSLIAESVRASLRGKEFIVKVFVTITDDPDYGRAVGRQFLVNILNHEAYKGFHEFLGRGDLLRPGNERWRAGDRAGAAEAIPDKVVDDLFLHGTAEQLAEKIAMYLHPAVTTLVIRFAPSPELTEASSLIAMLRSVAQAPELLKALRNSTSPAF